MDSLLKMKNNRKCNFFKKCHHHVTISISQSNISKTSDVYHLVQNLFYTLYIIYYKNIQIFNMMLQLLLNIVFHLSTLSTSLCKK